MRRLTVTIIIGVMLFVWAAWQSGARGQTPQQRSCLESEIGFHTGTLERLVGEPETVLADEEERVVVPGVAEDR